MKKIAWGVMAFALAGLVAAQDGAPAGSGAKKQDAKPAPAAEKPQDAKKPGEAAALDPEAEAWVDTLAKRIASTNTVVRDSASAGIEKVGKPALPILNKYATGTDKALADAAKKLAEKIQKGPQGPQGGGFAQRGAEQIDKLAKDMNLDEAKTQKLKDLQKKASDKMRENMDAMRNGDMTREEMMAEMQTFQTEMKSELRKFLSEDEAKKVEESVRGMFGGGRMGGGGGRRGGGGGG